MDYTIVHHAAHDVHKQYWVYKTEIENFKKKYLYWTTSYVHLLAKWRFGVINNPRIVSSSRDSNLLRDGIAILDKTDKCVWARHNDI